MSYEIPKGVQAEASRGLKLRKQFKRGGTEVGISTARKLARGGEVGFDFVKKVSQYFPRHEGDRLEQKDPPSNGWIAWLLWGGYPGWKWSKRIVDMRKKNPAVSASQYGMAQAVLSGASRAMPVKVARELVEKTPHSQRVKFARELASRRNPLLSGVATGLGVGAGLGLAAEVGKRVRGNPSSRDFVYIISSETGHHFGEGNYSPTVWRNAVAKARKYANADGKEMMIRAYSYYPGGEITKSQLIRPTKRGNPHKYYMVETPSGNTVKVGDRYAFTTLKQAREVAKAWLEGYKQHGTMVQIMVADPSFTQGYRAIEAYEWKDDNKRVVRINPGSLEESSQMFEEFHGRPSESFTDYEEDEVYNFNLAELGDLVELVIVYNRKDKTGIPLDFSGDDIKVAVTPDGQNLSLVGGDQSLSDDILKACGINGNEKDKDKLELGHVATITYHTDKQHLEGGGKSYDYEHHFGEEGGRMPTLVYDQLNQKLEFVGGSYKTLTEGIRD